ncbi:PepSY-like domain-containing protein [Brachyspira alvinipulli]|uniref:PepSY-like domain-containing protein n=1 Tax=Brachyspira alvinipulli TaxID=84379 RepID=UPI000488FC86|nr:PepSY-like domain-containing protein [Brachyspira alvinipulli]
MTKKLFALLITLTIISTSSLFADWVVPVSSLPQNARSFIQQIYPNTQIWKVERDDGKFEVKLSNGVKIEFLYNGDWNSIDGKYNAVPFEVLPQSVVNTIKNTYPQSVVIDAEKEWGSYKIKLNNFMELFVTADGQLMGQKFDD